MTDTTTDLDRFADTVRLFKRMNLSPSDAFELAAQLTGSDAGDPTTRRMHYLHDAQDCGIDSAVRMAVRDLALRATFRSARGVALAMDTFGQELPATFGRVYDQS
jgi:hypothetical protein